MKRRYSIFGTEYCSDHEVELAQVDSNPQAMVDAFMQKTVTVQPSIGGPKKKTKMRKYTWLRIVENVDG